MGTCDSQKACGLQEIKLFKEKNIKSKSNFSKKINKNIFVNILMPFLSIEDYKELIKVDKYFFNNIGQYFNSYLKYLKKLKERYDLLIVSNELDLSFELANKNKRFYKCQIDNSHYIKFTNSNIEHICIFEDEDWAWKDDSRYWMTKNNENSLIGEKIIKLKSVCWIDINVKMSKIPKGNYKLYIRHGVYKFQEEKLKLIIKLNEQIIYDEKYPKKNMIDECKNADGDTQGKIENSFLTDVIVNNDDNNIIYINFKHLNMNWKYNWEIDAIILK